MKEDPYKIKFLIYLILFTWFMIVLVMSENLITFFLGWEGVGLVSYLLISFWNTRIQANKSSIKAILINKIGDIGLIIFFMFCWTALNNGLCFEVHNIFVLGPMLVKFHIRTRLMESFRTIFQTWWCSEEKLHFTPVHTLRQLKRDEALIPPPRRVVEFRARYG